MAKGMTSKESVRNHPGENLALECCYGAREPPWGTIGQEVKKWKGAMRSQTGKVSHMPGGPGGDRGGSEQLG